MDMTGYFSLEKARITESKGSTSKFLEVPTVAFAIVRSFPSTPSLFSGQVSVLVLRFQIWIQPALFRSLLDYSSAAFLRYDFSLR